MKKLYFSFFCMLLLANSGCGPQPPQAPVQVLVMEVQSINCSSIGDFLTYENDTIRVAYAFWAENGRMGIFIYNKSDKPLYIDWKKCSFIVEGTKHDYWQDITTTNSSGSSTESDFSRSHSTSETESWFSYMLRSVSHSTKSSGVSNWTSQTFSSSTSIMTKPERITFIPPQTTICKADFSLINGNIMVKPTMEKDTTLDNMQKIKETFITTKGVTSRFVENISDGTQKVHLKFIQFSKEGSPFSFRSFIAYSTDEKFLSEAYVNSQFYIAKITQMPISVFDLKRDKLHNNANPWAAHNSFFLINTHKNNSPN